MRGPGDGSTPTVLLRSAAAPLPPVQALIVKDDTFLVLGDPHGAVETDFETVRPDRIVPGPGRALGTALLRGGRPVLISAIVHDLDRDPTWTERWVGDALAAAFEIVREEGFTAVALELLGAKHGGLDPLRFGDALERALDRHPPPEDTSVWVLVPAGLDPTALGGPGVTT